jgi:predicted site-specific integrase-resolvase
MDNEKFLQPSHAAKLLDVTTRTLFTWEEKGKIKAIRTSGGHRRYILSSFPNYQKFIKQKRNICYCRVSTSSQKEDLERQEQYFRTRFPNYEIVRDIGSGINFKRKGFNSILDSALKGDISEIVVTHRDRLCRFGFELIERIVSKFNGKIVVLDKEKTSPEKELVDDLLSIITVFSSRLYGLRSHSIKNKIKEATKNGNPIENDEIPIVS